MQKTLHLRWSSCVRKLSFSLQGEPRKCVFLTQTAEMLSLFLSSLGFTEEAWAYMLPVLPFSATRTASPAQGSLLPPEPQPSCRGVRCRDRTRVCLLWPRQGTMSCKATIWSCAMLQKSEVPPSVRHGGSHAHVFQKMLRMGSGYAFCFSMEGACPTQICRMVHLRGADMQNVPRAGTLTMSC